MKIIATYTGHNTFNFKIGQRYVLNVVQINRLIIATKTDGVHKDYNSVVLFLKEWNLIQAIN